MDITTITLSGAQNVLDLINAMNLTPEGTCDRNAWLVDICDAQLSLNRDDIHWFHTFFKHRPPRPVVTSVAILTGEDADMAVVTQMAHVLLELNMQVRLFDSHERQAAEQFLRSTDTNPELPASSA